MRYLGAKGRCGPVAAIINGFNPLYYWEPFVGSAQMMERVHAPYRLGSDTNASMIAMLRAVQAGWDPPATLTEEEHARWKEEWKRGGVDPMIAFAGGCSFGGDVRGGYARNRKGVTDPGAFAGPLRTQLLRQRLKLAGVRFEVGDYRKVLNTRKIQRMWWSEVVYCDPPYQSTTRVGDGGEFDHDAFWRWAEDLSETMTVLVSEYQCPLKGHRVLWESTRDSGMRYADGKATKTERLFCLNARTWSKVGLGVL